MGLMPGCADVLKHEGTEGEVVKAVQDPVEQEGKKIGGKKIFKTNRKKLRRDLERYFVIFLPFIFLPSLFLMRSNSAAITNSDGYSNQTNPQIL